jgi:hypothetical protein
MPYEKHEELTTPPRHTVLWRYLSFVQFVQGGVTMPAAITAKEATLFLPAGAAQILSDLGIA